jgi:hypothetical protein
MIRGIVIQRDLPEMKGMLVGLDVTAKTVKVSGNDSEIRVSGDARITLNESPATLDDLRVNNDQVAIATGADKTAGSVRASRVPRYDRAVIAIGASTNRDRSIPVIDNAVEEARAIRDAAVDRFATPPEWAVLLAEPTREEVLAALKQRLDGLRSSSQLLVTITVQAFLADGMPVLALADYRPNEPAKTGLPLADVLALIDAAPPSQKFVMLDVIHPRPGLEDAPASVDALLKDVPRPKSTKVFLGPPDALERGVNDSAFGPLIAHGLKGSADSDRDLTITPEEWTQHLIKMGPTGATVWPE